MKPGTAVRILTGAPLPQGADTVVPVEETVRSFKEIIEGKHDDIPERAFLLKGTIDDVVAAAKGD